MKPSTTLLAILLLGAVASAPAATLSEDDPGIITSTSFLNRHPDLRFRSRAYMDYRAGRHAEAFRGFQEAARYADKLSQAMIAEMLWKGEGVAQDRALAYAWMDLAAERGSTPLVTLREQYWAGLDEAERSSAIERGAKVYDDYGDDVAKPRLARFLERERRQVTGSRVGHVGTVVLPQSMHTSKSIMTPKGSLAQGAAKTEVTTAIDGSIYYADRYWQPEAYAKWQETRWTAAWLKAGGSGSVSIGDLIEATEARPAGK